MVKRRIDDVVRPGQADIVFQRAAIDKADVVVAVGAFDPPGAAAAFNGKKNFYLPSFFQIVQKAADGLRCRFRHVFGLPDHVFPVFGFDDFDMRSPAVKAAVQFQHAARPETDGQAAVGVFADLLAGVKNVVFGGGGRAGVKKPFVFKCRFAEQSEIFTAMVFQAKVTVADK